MLKNIRLRPVEATYHGADGATVTRTEASPDILANAPPVALPADVTWQAAKRQQLYNSAQNILVHDLAWLPLYIPHRIAYVRPGVSNVAVTGYGIIPEAGSWSMVRVRSSLPGSPRFR